jgi:hypothetical protein
MDRIELDDCELLMCYPGTSAAIESGDWVVWTVGPTADWALGRVVSCSVDEQTVLIQWMNAGFGWVRIESMRPSSVTIWTDFTHASLDLQQQLRAELQARP